MENEKRETWRIKIKDKEDELVFRGHDLSYESPSTESEIRRLKERDGKVLALISKEAFQYAIIEYK